MPRSINVGSRLNNYFNRKIAGLYGLAQNAAQQMEGQAKRKARWTDRTGNARQGLKGTVVKTNNMITIYLIHSVSYGIYLEKARSGKYAIIKPIFRANQSNVMSSLRRYWDNT